MSLPHQSEAIVGDKYRIGDVLGKGSVGITYRATNLQTGATVAVKAISLKRLGDWKQIELFQREAEVLAKLDHRCIPKYIDYFVVETDTDKAFYLVQELAPGKSLAELVESGWRVNETEVKQIAQQILAILGYLHALEPPVIHRDIKPHNLIRNHDGTIYLVDFGAVQNIYYNTLMQGSTVVGTYGYMAPEQFRGQALPATDLYSLGATLLYLLTHRSPAELPQDTLKLDFRSSVKLSEGFAQWLEKMLEPDKDARFALAEVALAELAASQTKKLQQQYIKWLAFIGTGVLAAGIIAGSMPQRWGWLSRFGFYPNDICSSEVSQRFFQQGGSLNSIRTADKLSILACTIENEPTQVAKQRLLSINNITEIINQNIIVSDNSYHNRFSTLLNKAVIENKPEIAKLLLDFGADPNLKSEYNQTTPLFNAVNKNYELVKLLIEHGANVNSQDEDGNTPLLNMWFYEITDDEVNIAKLLIEHGADVNIQNKDNDTPLSKVFASRTIYQNEDKTTDLIKLLIEHGANKLDNRDLRGNSKALHRAIVKGDQKLAEFLIEQGVKVNSDVYPHRQTHLSSAVITGDKEMVKLLISNGAYVNAILSGRNPLSYAIQNEDQEMIELLIKHGAIPNS